MAIQAVKAYQAQEPAANSQCPSLSVARGFKACQEHSANLRHEHIITHQLPSLRIFQAQQLPSYRVAQTLWIHRSELSQQIAYNDMDSFQISLSLACSLSGNQKINLGAVPVRKCVRACWKQHHLTLPSALVNAKK